MRLTISIDVLHENDVLEVRMGKVSIGQIAEGEAFDNFNGSGKIMDERNYLEQQARVAEKIYWVIRDAVRCYNTSENLLRFPEAPAPSHQQGTDGSDSPCQLQATESSQHNQD